MLGFKIFLFRLKEEIRKSAVFFFILQFSPILAQMTDEMQENLKATPDGIPLKLQTPKCISEMAPKQLDDDERRKTAACWCWWRGAHVTHSSPARPIPRCRTRFLRPSPNLRIQRLLSWPGSMPRHVKHSLFLLLFVLFFLLSVILYLKIRSKIKFGPLSQLLNWTILKLSSS